MLRNRRLWIVAAFLAAVVATGGGIYYQQHRLKHFAVHEPGMVYRSAWLQPSALSDLIEKYQIRSVVNLCKPDEMTPAMWEGERSAVAGAGAVLHAIPLPNSVDVDPDKWSRHFAIMADPDNYPMLVHCQHGVTRTAMFLAAYDVIHRHKTADESIAGQPMFGHDRASVHIRAFGRKFDEFYRENRARLASNALGVLR
jgi:hypothetical protein